MNIIKKIKKQTASILALALFSGIIPVSAAAVNGEIGYSKISDENAKLVSPSLTLASTLNSLSNHENGIQVDFTENSSVADWSNISNVRFAQDTEIGNYMVADGASAESAPKTPAFKAEKYMIAEFDMMLPSQKADGVTANVIGGGMTGGIALMQGDKVAGVIGFRGNGKGEPDNIISTGASSTDYVNALAGNKATAYFDTWMHYTLVVDTENKKGDLYMIHPKDGTVYQHEARFDKYVSSITELTNIGIVSNEGYAIAIANLKVSAPEPTSVALSAEDNMEQQYIPGEGNVASVQYNAEVKYRLSYNKNNTAVQTDTDIRLAKNNTVYTIRNSAGEETEVTGMSISKDGLLEIQSNAVAGEYIVQAQCGNVSDRLPLEIIANAPANQVQIYGEDDIVLGEQADYSYTSIALADNEAVLPEKETRWELVGDSLGCAISQEGVLTTGNQSGKITLKATLEENEVSNTLEISIRTSQEASQADVQVQGVYLSDGKTEFSALNGIQGIAIKAKKAYENATVKVKAFNKNNVCISEQTRAVTELKKQAFGLDLKDPVSLKAVAYVRVTVTDYNGNIISEKTQNITSGKYKGISLVGDWVTGKNSGLGMGGNVLNPDTVPAGVDPALVNTYTSEAKYAYSNYDTVVDEKVNTNNLLWYKTGAWSADKTATIYARDGKDWEEQALPIGNGYMGGMLFGMPAKDHIQFNEETFWAAGYRGTQDKQSPSYINPNMSESINGFMNAGNIFVDFGLGRGETVTNYYRDLNLEESVAHVQYEYNGATYNREYFASYPKEVIALHYSADQEGALNFTVNPVSAHPGSITVENGEITIIGKLKDSEPYKGGGIAEWNQESDLEYCTKVKVILNDEKGEIIDQYGSVEVQNASNVTVLVAAATDYDPNQFSLKENGTVDLTKTPYKNERGVQAAIDKTTERINNAAAMSYADLKAEHIADYKSQFDKVKFSLTEELCKTPTNELQASYKNVIGTKTNADGTTSVSYDDAAYNNLDKHLEALHYNYARYMMISSSRANTMPATLQGKWCQSVSEIWGSCYCININMEMNYWFAGGANLLDSGKALVKWFHSQIPAGKVTAKNMYGVTPKSYTYADGKMAFADSAEDKDDVFIMHTKQAIMGTTDMTGSANIQSAGNTAWLMYNLWDLYQTTGDKQLLENELYPIMRKAANFYTQYLYTNMKKITADTEKYPDGYYYTTWKGRSPEQGPTQEGIKYDLQLVAGMYDYTIKAAEVLGMDNDKIAAWKEIRNHLEIPVELGADGQIKEWAQETTYNTDENGNALGDPVHRHISHLVGLYPGTLINRDTPELLNGAKVVLEKRGDDATGWSCSNKFLLWARTLEGDKALELFRYQLAQKTYSNLFDTHAPFQIDGNFGSAAAVMELLMQSHTGKTYILPALPAQWKTGEISGIKAKDGSEVSIQWSDGKAVEFTIVPAADGDITVGYEKDNQAFMLNGSYITFGEDHLYTIHNAKAGTEYKFISTEPREVKIILTKDHVEAQGVSDGILMVAGYDKDGTLTRMEFINGMDSAISGYEECVKLKAFLWDSMEGMKPLCESAEYKL